MKIAYLILVHKNPKQLERLISRLNNKNVIFIIHIDKKVDNNILKRFIDLRSIYGNIIYTKKRYKVNWGHFSIVQATLECIKTLFYKNIKFDYAFLLSGQHYPIKSNKKILSFLNKNKGKSFIEYWEIPPLKNNHLIKWENERGGLDRFERWHFSIMNAHIMVPPSKDWIMGKIGILIKKISPEFFYYLKEKKLDKNIYSKQTLKSLIIKRKFPYRLKLYGGYQWWIFTKELTEFCFKFSEKNKKYVKFFRFSRIPDESFFQILALNSRYKEKIINKNILFDLWTKDSKHPEILRLSDFDKIKNSKALFARKFDENVDSEILDLIDKNILYK